MLEKLFFPSHLLPQKLIFAATNFRFSDSYFISPLSLQSDPYLLLLLHVHVYAMIEDIHEALQHHIPRRRKRKKSTHLHVAWSFLLLEFLCSTHTHTYTHSQTSLCVTVCFHRLLQARSRRRSLWCSRRNSESVHGAVASWGGRYLASLAPPVSVEWGWISPQKQNAGDWLKTDVHPSAASLPEIGDKSGFETFKGLRLRGKSVFYSLTNSILTIPPDSPDRKLQEV